MVSKREDALKHAVFMARCLKGCGLQCAITTILLELGISAKHDGFDYLEKAILIFMEDPTQALTKEVYPSVGRSYKPRRPAYLVERSIRRSIEVAWSNRDEEIWNCYFPPGEFNRARRPTNGDFLFMIVRFLRLWQGCCEGVHENAE